MHSTLYSPATSNQFHYPWVARDFHYVSSKPILKKLEIRFPKTLIAPNSLRTSINYEPEEGLNEIPGPISSERLPVVIRRSGGVSRYKWDGSDLKLVNVDGGVSALPVDFEDGYRKLLRVSSLAVRDFFIPKRVPENYMEYVKWKFLHRVFSSALQVLATQAMFRAIGVGYSRLLPSAAALNWVLEDALGRLSRCIYTASFASTFDTNLKVQILPPPCVCLAS